MGALTLATACGPADAPVTPPPASAEARFAYLTYSGSDPIFDLPLSEGQARNPILAIIRTPAS